MTGCDCLDTWDYGRYVTDAREAQGESRLLLPLLRWLAQTQRISPGTHIARELPWFGRRVDVATLTRSRRAVAYELKLASLGRALEQAAYNRLAFDRSYVVTESVPKPENVSLAAEYGIGLIVVRWGVARLLLSSPVRRPTRDLRDRLLDQMRLAACLSSV